MHYLTKTDYIMTATGVVDGKDIVVKAHRLSGKETTYQVQVWGSNKKVILAGHYTKERDIFSMLAKAAVDAVGTVKDVTAKRVVDKEGVRHETALEGVRYIESRV